MVKTRVWIGGSPPQRYREVMLTCDECGSREEELYERDGVQLCLNCFVNLLMETTEHTVITTEWPADD